jgi:hypothetical protein
MVGAEQKSKVYDVLFSGFRPLHSTLLLLLSFACRPPNPEQTFIVWGRAGYHQEHRKSNFALAPLPQTLKQMDGFVSFLRTRFA